MKQNNLKFSGVIDAFTRQSVIYDDYEKENQTLIWMRKQVRKHAMSFLNPGDKLLELNSGTGTDAVYFAQKGILVHSTDISNGMIQQIRKKVNDNNLSHKISFEQCSYTELNKIKNNKFDFIFSNFGGLNCLVDLSDATKFFPSLLNEGGKVCLVIMPPICPWELANIFRGKFKFAFRRLKTSGTPAHIEGIHFTTHYYSLKNVMKALGDKFSLVKSEVLAVCSPNPQMEKFQKKFPRLTQLLNKLDESLSAYFPFNKIGDHIILTALYSSK